MLWETRTVSGIAPHAMTFDVEEWFHAHALRLPREKWHAIPSRLERPIDEILALLDQHDTRATFFVLGWVAERDPSIVRRIHAAGHEIASHGYGHQSVTTLSRVDFREDVRVSKSILEDITGEAVLGYRAPSYSVGPETDWVFDELEALGFAYDSSVVPARAPHGGYGVPGAALGPRRVRPGLWELPLPTLRLLGRRIPAATGAYLRLCPLLITRCAFAQNRRRGLPVVVNIHPWELDPQQPRWPTRPWISLRHYGRLRTTRRKLASLLGTYRFVPLRELYIRCAALIRAGSAGDRSTNPGLALGALQGTARRGTAVQVHSPR